jgi:phospholipid/cholesterol/gamma-HCH transport system substrate-binding protein
MDNKRLEVKVGLFVFIGLFLLAVLLIWFSKGTSVFLGTYTLHLRAVNVGGLKVRASVLLAGVNVGDVSAIDLEPDGRHVNITLNIYKNVKIFHDAHFVIEQAGFLGDNFVAIIPTENTEPILADGDKVDCEPPFDLQAVARSATGFIQRVDETVRKIEDSVTQLQKNVLNQETMTNLSMTISNLRAASDEAVVAVGNINSLVATNRDQVNFAISNVVYFSQDLTNFSGSASSILATNGVVISEAVSNLAATAVTLKGISDDMKAGKGLAGAVLENQELATNVEITINNLAIASSNLNEYGLWGFLWHKTPPPKKAPSKYSTPRESQKP